MQRIPLLCLLLLLPLACGGAGSPASTADKKAEKPAKRAPEELKNRSQSPLTTTHETIGAVGFAIDLPADLKREANDKENWINWTFTDGNPFMEPSITVKLDDPAMTPRDFETFVRRAAPMSQDKPPPAVVKQEELPGGAWLAVVERSDALFLKVEALHRKDDKLVRCTLIQRTGTGKPDDRPIPEFTATKAWAEKICASVKID